MHLGAILPKSEVSQRLPVVQVKVHLCSDYGERAKSLYTGACHCRFFLKCLNCGQDVGEIPDSHTGGSLYSWAIIQELPVKAGIRRSAARKCVYGPDTLALPEVAAWTIKDANTSTDAPTR